MLLYQRLLRYSLFALSIVSFSHAQDSILIDGKSVTLGMKRDLALAEFQSARYKLVELTDGALLIAGPNNSDKPIGVLTFKDGKVYSAQRTWAQSEDYQAAKIIEQLFAALSSRLGEESTSVTIQIQQFTQPNLNHKSISILVGQTTFSVSHTAGDNTKVMVEINEDIRRRQ